MDVGDGDGDDDDVHEGAVHGLTGRNAGIDLPLGCTPFGEHGQGIQTAPRAMIVMVIVILIVIMMEGDDGDGDGDYLYPYSYP